jgi:hypothetical protein
MPADSITARDVENTTPTRYRTLVAFDNIPSYRKTHGSFKYLTRSAAPQAGHTHHISHQSRIYLNPFDLTHGQQIGSTSERLWVCPLRTGVGVLRDSLRSVSRLSGSPLDTWSPISIATAKRMGTHYMGPQQSAD